MTNQANELFASIARPNPVESDYVITRMEGEIPRDLNGTLYRNGPSQKIEPAAGSGVLHFFDGDALVHAIRFEDGQARYRGRFAQTESFLREQEEGVYCHGGLNVGPDRALETSLANEQPNTNVVAHSDRLFAMAENMAPFELDPTTLESKGRWNYDGKMLGMSTTAHPRIDGKTGQMWIHGYQPIEPYLQLYVVEPDGSVSLAESHDAPWPSMMHDFAITKNYVIFMDLPILFSFENLAEKGMPFIWQPEYGARLGVMPRDGGNADVKWFEIDPCYVFHPMNAYEQQGSIVMDVARYEKLWQAGGDDFDQAKLTRWTIDTSGGGVKEEPLDDRSIEFPRIDPRCEGLRNRFGYAVSTDASDGIATERLVKYDLERNTSEFHDFGSGRTPSEAVFVPASPDAAEDEGFLLSYVYDAERNSSDFVILDAQNLTREPLAIVPLPQRVPMGFHGNWIPDPS